MKQQKVVLAKYDNKVKTSWHTLMYLVAFSVCLTIYLATSILEESYQIIHIETAEANIIKPEPKVVQIITESEYKKQQEKEIFLDKLSFCESQDYALALGDGGNSLGYYQWQYASLQDVMGQYLTYDEYYDIATDYEESRKWAYKAIYQDGEWWRWFNCTNKINNEKNS